MYFPHVTIYTFSFCLMLSEQIQLLKRAVQKFRGQVTVDGTEVVAADGADGNVQQNTTRRGHSITGSSPLHDRLKSAGNRRKSHSGQRNVTIKTSLPTVPSPALHRNDTVGSSPGGNDVILHVGGTAWTRESIAYGGGESGDTTRPNSEHGRSNGDRNIQLHQNQNHRKALETQSPLISPTTSIIDEETPRLRPTTADSLTSIVHTKTAGDYVHPSSERRGGGVTQSLSFTQSTDESHSIRFVDEQYHPSGKNAAAAAAAGGSIRAEVVQNAFNEYKADINQSLGQLDTKINRLESMISLLVERIPTTTSTTTTNPNNNKNNPSSSSINKNNIQGK